MLGLGGAFEAVDELKGRLVASQAERVGRIESGDLRVVGVNCFTESEPSPLASRPGRHRHRVEGRPGGRGGASRRRSPSGGATAMQARSRTRSTRCAKRREDESQNIMLPTIALAHAGGTTGEWADVLREVVR